MEISSVAVFFCQHIFGRFAFCLASGHQKRQNQEVPLPKMQRKQPSRNCMERRRGRFPRFQSVRQNELRKKMGVSSQLELTSHYRTRPINSSHQLGSSRSREQVIFIIPPFWWIMVVFHIYVY